MTRVCAHACSIQRIHRDEELTGSEMLRVLHTLGRSLGHSTCSTSARTFVSIPVIDIHPLVDLDSVCPTVRTFAGHGSHAKGSRLWLPCVQAHADRQKVASQLHDACKNVGFFYVRNHGALWPACQSSHSPYKFMWTCGANGVLYNWPRWNACRSARGAVPGRFEGSSALVQLAGVPSTACI